MEINRRDTAVVFIDPQNEVLSETGKAWPLVRESLAENNTIENMVVKDATAAPKHPTWGYGYTAALINYAYLAHAVLRADEVIDAMQRG
jgi:hypothetical protein